MAKKTNRKKVYETFVKSITLYGPESSEITKRDRQKLEATEMEFLRRSCRVS